jgi:hypothetical protein
MAANKKMPSPLFLIVDAAANKMSSHPSSSHRKRLSLSKGELRRISTPKGEDDWNLRGGGEAILTRTRGGGKGKPIVDMVVESDEVTVVDDDDKSVHEEEEAVEAPPPANKKKPSNNRVVLEVDQIDKVVAALACRECGDTVKATVRNVCIASSIGIECMMWSMAGCITHSHLQQQRSTLPEEIISKEAQIMQ